MSNIRAIKAREILDSQGVPTIQIILWVEDGRSVIATVPNEWAYNNPKTVVIKDEDNQEFNGKGVKKVVANINQEIGPQLIGKSSINQGEIDQFLINLDGTNEKSQLGANALLGISMAVLKAGSLSTGLPLYSYIQQKYQLTDIPSIPSCVYPLITGGDFGNNNLDFQEFELIPASHVNFFKSITIASTIREKVKKVIESKGGSVCSGPTGGFLPKMNNNSDVFELILEAIKTTQYTFTQDIFFGLDAAADSIQSGNAYKLRDKPDNYHSSELITFYKNLRERYKTIYLEDPFGLDDEDSWQEITKSLGNTTKVVGDELFLGDGEKLKKAIKNNTCNSLSIKILDKGTVSEALHLIKLAKEAEWTVIVSEHSGETNETFLADLAVGVGADYVKFGPPNRGERVAKYNRLIEINEEIEPPQSSSNEENSKKNSSNIQQQPQSST